MTIEQDRERAKLGEDEPQDIYDDIGPRAVADAQHAKAVSVLLWGMVEEMESFANAPDDCDGLVRTSAKAKKHIGLWAAKKRHELEALNIVKPLVDNLLDGDWDSVEKTWTEKPT